MKIIYSKYFDSEIYLGDKPKVMGDAYMGDMGLLTQLELRAGLHSVSKTDVEREAEYLNALKGCIKGTIFEKTFNVDELGVASKLLGWRDALIMAGWEVNSYTNISEKLKILADAEKKFSCIGIADRWRKVSKIYHNKGIDFSDQVESVDVIDPWDDIPLLIQKTLEGLESAKVNIKKRHC